MYFLDRDNSGHSVIVPEAHRADWEAFLDIPEDDEASWDYPEYVIGLGCSPAHVIFPSFNIL